MALLVFLSLLIYQSLFWLTSFFWPIFLRYRIYKGKEDSKRWREKTGAITRARPSGSLIWVNAVSVGEILAALTLIRRLPEIYPKTTRPRHVLLTTTTKSAANMVHNLLPDFAFHQYMVLDHPHYVKRFLSHWRPDLALWVESELWPNIIHSFSKSQKPCALINARLSPSSFRHWMKMRPFADFLLSHFDLCLAQSAKDKTMFEALGARHIVNGGNLKYDSEPLSFNEDRLAFWRALLGKKRLFLAASTHHGEEMALARIWRDGFCKRKDAVMMIAPRHPPRGLEIALALGSLGLSVTRYSQNPKPKQLSDIYIIDELGHLGLFYRLADIVFMGGSLIKHGGQNPLEPARLDCALLSGKEVFNFQDIYRLFEKADGVLLVEREKIHHHLADLLNHPEKIKQMSANAHQIAGELKGAVDKHLTHLAPLMKAL